MNKLIFLLLQSLFVFVLHATDKMIDVYYVLPDVSTEELRDMNLASSFIAETFKKNYFTGVNLIYTQDEEKYVKSYEKGNQRMLGSHLLTVAKYYSHLNPIAKYYFVHSLNKNLFEEYIILSKNITSVQGIKGVRGIVDGSQNSEIFSDMTCLSIFKKGCRNVLSLKKAKNPQDAVFKVYFDQADIAFIPLRSWEAALKLNPSLDNKMHIITKSPKVFTFGVLSMRINVNSENVAMLKEVNNDMVSKAEGKQLSLISKVKSTKLITPAEIEPVMAYYLKYLELKRHL